MKLELRDVACGYQGHPPIVKNINMELESGDVCCILGPNGVGKTTLFKTILNLLPPLSGQVCVDGENTAPWKPQKLSRTMAYVAQAHTPTFPYLVKEVAMMGRMGQIGTMGQPGREDHEIVEQALEDMGIRHLRDVPYSDISGGERQLLLIARALVQQPKVLIMDEPTANLDYGNMVRVMENIRRLADQGLCVVFTTHMPDQAFMCRAKTALLLRGQPALFGPADAVVTERSLYEAYHAKIQILDVIGADDIPLKVVVPRLSGTTGKDRNPYG
jgi:iron complex transport system ATP-binding protein